MKLLAIDPSVNNVGVAQYDTDTGKLKTHIIHPTGSSTLDKAKSICYRLCLVKPDVVIVEYPQWEASSRGAIAVQKGYTLDLAFIAGYIASDLGEFKKVILPTPRDWKNNAPKRVTEHRVLKHFGVELNISEHEFDAAGMILWYLSKTKPLKKGAKS